MSVLMIIKKRKQYKHSFNTFIVIIVIEINHFKNRPKLRGSVSRNFSANMRVSTVLKEIAAPLFAV